MSQAIKAQNAYMLSLVCDSIKTVEVVFNVGTPEVVKTYTYLTILDLEEGQDVIVETPQGLSIAQVYKVHEEPEIEPGSGINYKWAVGTDAGKARKEQNRLHELVIKSLKDLQAAKRKASRRKVKKELEDLYGDTFGKLGDRFALPDGSDK